MTQDTPRRGTCAAEDCAKRVEVRGFCNKHYMRWRRHGDPRVCLAPVRGRVCAVEGCEERHWAKGFCVVHYGRWSYSGTPAGSPLRFVPAQPLQDCLRALLREMTHAEVAVRLGLSPKTGVRHIFRRDTVTFATADRYATALGLHIDILWPEEVTV